MPWALLTRVLVRLLASMLAWRVAGSRRGAAVPRGPAQRRAPGPARVDAREAVTTLREGASIGWRLATAAAFLAAAGVLISAGVTLTVLSPRWLGITLLALALAALTATAFDVRAAARLLLARRRRRHERRLREQLS